MTTCIGASSPSRRRRNALVQRRRSDSEAPAKPSAPDLITTASVAPSQSTAGARLSTRTGPTFSSIVTGGDDLGEPSECPACRRIWKRDHRSLTPRRRLANRIVFWNERRDKGACPTIQVANAATCDCHNRDQNGRGAGLVVV